MRLFFRTISFCVIAVALVCVSPRARAGSLTCEELVRLEEKLAVLAKSCIPKTVCVRNYMKGMGGRGAHGSGAVISADGQILTCSHVVTDTEKLEVMFPDGRILEAKVLGECRQNDYALIKVDAKNLDYFRLGDSGKLSLGEWVCALGHPGGPNLDLKPAFSAGRVTGLEKTLALELWSRTYVGAVQTDVPIFAGNSGGPLVDLGGKLLGLNGAILLVNENAYSVAIDLIKPNLAALRRGEDVTGKSDEGNVIDLLADPDRGMKDKALSEKVKAFCRKHKLGNQSAIYRKLKEFKDGGGNVDRLIADLDALAGKGEDVGEVINELFDLGVKKTETGKDPAAGESPTVSELSDPILGFRISPDAPEGCDGVLVLSVKRGSIAARAGLEPGDIIVAVGDLSVSSPDDFRLFITWVKVSKEVGENEFELKIIRSGKPVTLNVSLDEDREGE